MCRSPRRSCRPCGDAKGKHTRCQRWLAAPHQAHAHEWTSPLGGGCAREEDAGSASCFPHPSTTGGELTFASRNDRLSSRSEKQVPDPEKSRTRLRPSLRGLGWVGGGGAGWAGCPWVRLHTVSFAHD